VCGINLPIPNILTLSLTISHDQDKSFKVKHVIVKIEFPVPFTFISCKDFLSIILCNSHTITQIQCILGISHAYNRIIHNSYIYIYIYIFLLFYSKTLSINWSFGHNSQQLVVPHLAPRMSLHHHNYISCTHLVHQGFTKAHICLIVTSNITFHDQDACLSPYVDRCNLHTISPCLKL
jgi:hypothetical protein